jgi:hypothetical protein
MSSVPFGSELERLLFHWPSVAAAAQRGDCNEWARDFARSISMQSRRRGWRPSIKQHEIMQRMVNDLFLHTGTGEGDHQVIE